MRSLLALACVAALATGLAACGSGDDETGDGGPRVVATTTQLADIARNIAGDRASVTEILTPNSDPHDYEPRPGDARALADAGLVLQSGGDVDEWLGDLVKSAGADAQVVTLIDDVHRRTGEGDEVDPHWWQDPRNVEIAVRRIRDALARVDGGGTATYDANAEAYLGRLRGARHRDRALHGRDPGRAAPSRDQPRRARLLRRPLRHHGGRGGHPGAVDRGARVGRRDPRPGRDDPARARLHDLPRVVGEPEAREGDRGRGRREGRAGPVGGHAGARRTRPGRPT